MISRVTTQTAVILIMAVVILTLILFPQRCQSDKGDLLKDYIKQKQAETASLKRENEALTKAVEKHASEMLVKQRRFSIEIDSMSRVVRQLRAKVHVKIQNDPQLIAFVAAQDSVISHQAGRIAQLEKDHRISELIARDLLTVQAKQITIGSEIDGTKDQIIKAQAKQIKKLKAGRFFRNVLIPVAPVVFFVAGAVPLLFVKNKTY